MFNTSSRRAASRRAGDRANPWRADRADNRTFRLVKATLEIPAEVVRHQREVVDRAFAVLKSQWGLSSVELRSMRLSQEQRAFPPTLPGTRSKWAATASPCAWNTCDTRR